MLVCSSLFTTCVVRQFNSSFIRLVSVFISNESTNRSGLWQSWVVLRWTYSATCGVKMLNKKINTTKKKHHCKYGRGSTAFPLWGWTACHHRGGNAFPSLSEFQDNVWVTVCWWSWEKVGWCSRTITLNIKVNLVQNSFRDIKSTFRSGPVRAQTSI